MNKKSKSKLTLTTQTIRMLDMIELRGAVGGTVLVSETDPVTSRQVTYESCKLVR